MVYSGWQVNMAERTSRCRLACESSVSVGLGSRNGILDVLHPRKILKPAFNPFDNYVHFIQLCQKWKEQNDNISNTKIILFVWKSFHFHFYNFEKE